MMKRILALVLCLASLLLCFTACSRNSADKGAYIRMYLAEPIYDFDPLEAFDNKNALQIVSLLFEGLFYADENGKAKKQLVDDYTYTVDKEKGTYALTLVLKETCWSDGTKVSASDVQFAFRRLFDSDTSHIATALLYDVKNARKIVSGEVSIDKLGVTVVDGSTVEIEFEKDIDLDAFLLTLCSPALYPLRDNVVSTNADWGKKVASMVCSGPFIVRSMNYDEKDGFILERNSYYYRDRAKDEVDVSVDPYRIIVDFTTPSIEQLKSFDSKDKNAIYYFGNLDVAARGSDSVADILKKADENNVASTHVYYLNQTAEVLNKTTGETTTLFADAKVRKALSLAINREAIAKALVYATAADGLVPHSVLNRADKKAEFRKKAESYIATSADTAAAAALLKEAGITASDYTFTIKVAAYADEHLATASLVKEAWKALGFDVDVEVLEVFERVEIVTDELGIEETVHTGIYENPYKDALKSGDFEAIALDLVSPSVSAFGYLAPFATAFSGNATVFDSTSAHIVPHITGYSSAAYDEKIEAAYAAANEKERAALLHEAEKILLDDMPVIPITYGKTISLRSSKLKKVESTFFCSAIFTEAKLSGYLKIALRDGFLTQEELDKAEKEAKAAKEAAKKAKKAKK